MVTGFKVFDAKQKLIPIDFKQICRLRLGSKFEWISLLEKGIVAKTFEVEILDSNTCDIKSYNGSFV